MWDMFHYNVFAFQLDVVHVKIFGKEPKPVKSLSGHWLHLLIMFVNECLQRLEKCVLMRLHEPWLRIKH